MHFKVQDVQKRVEDSFCKSKNVSNRWHGVCEELALKNLITPPESRRFHHLTEEGHSRLRWLWAVWDECPSTNDGHLVVYDPREERFGLATKPDYQHKHGSFLGFYGSELGDALESL